MYFLWKLCTFGIYTLAVYLFAYYTHISHWIDSYNNWFFVKAELDTRQYDFIVVGAGSAGATVAAELVQGGNDVLLIEAGGSPAPFFGIPVLAPLLQRSPYDWGYRTVPQKNACKGLSDNQSVWPQGKILGGSGRLNNMAYITGHSKDYEKWFPDFEDYKFPESGEIINEPRWSTHLTDAVLKAINEIFLNEKTDFRRVQLTMKNGARWSPDRLLRTCPDDLLKIITHALVEKLIFDGKYAKGVEFSKWGRKLRASARKGVVVSAGAIGSPKLLMLSGIGPEKDLEALKIEVINDLPVGKNLVDHLLTAVDLITINETSSLSIGQVLNPMSAVNYMIFGTGPWTSAGIEALGTFYSSKQNIKNEAPALQLMIIPAGISQDNGVVLRKSMGISDEVFHSYFSPLVYKNAITIAPVLLHPKSSGRVKLKSADPLDDPIIDPNYLSSEEDVSTLVEGIQLVKRIIKTKAMKKLGASLYEKLFPGCENFPFDTVKYWECYIRHLTLTSYHPAGTCRMGEVVDHSFRVLNTKNLYVVDASVLPTLPSGNINAAVMMLAKKAGGMLNALSTKKSCEKSQNSCNKVDYFSLLYRFKADSLIYRVSS